MTAYAPATAGASRMHFYVFLTIGLGSGVLFIAVLAWLNRQKRENRP